MSIQLSIISILAFLIHKNKDLESHLANNYIYLWISMTFTILICFFGLFFRSRIQTKPINYICMFLWTVSFGMTLIYILSIGKTILGVMSFILFTGLVISQLLYTLTVRYELTYQGSTLFLFGTQLIVFHIFTLLSNISFIQMILVSFLGFVFAFYLIFDTQSNVTGPQIDFNKEEWASGSVLVYMDIILLIMRVGDLLRSMFTKKQD
ncbi:hypothetical protein IMG5_141220 [Ichthyophthirius multifiliis]|uniref:Uncharacterized protein n=1 Tax=Ichthyophthirius multifiliis TaxID=5932 RepID=G0QXC9_ICHMU|nr:hypothetical protein IMG5_141220 [Ichthyophthirius multifiliis]EGR30125.1 hypothetical protein IMG5_141220 [Ichthyophthirius multifiliis]|eukprot:XP_004031361.1 hypothetical protein IMG5_141220 [Ichthyophthirius multifiliis]